MTTQQKESKPLVSPDALLTVHGRICDEFGRLEGLRQSMLGYVPGFTVIFGGASIFVGALTKSPIIENFLVAIGFLGMFATFALFVRELFLNHESLHLAEQGRKYQEILHIPETMFMEEDDHKILTTSISTILVYASSFTGWFCVATWFAWPG